MEFVDIWGKRIDMDALSRERRAPSRSPSMREADEHHGWEVRGFSERELESARKEHELRVRAAIEMNERLDAKREAGESVTQKAAVIPPPWDEERYMREKKGRRIGRVYATQQAAMDCASLARKAGYKGVEVHPIIKKAQIAKAGK